MNLKKLTLVAFFLMNLVTSVSAEQSPQYLGVNVDNLVINTDGLALASDKLSSSIDRLSASFQKLSASDKTFTNAEKEALLNSAASVEQASQAITELARKLPQMSQDFSSQLPQILENTRQPIAELSGGLQAASASVINIVEHLPAATANAKKLVDSSLNAALFKVGIVAAIIVLLLVLALLLMFRYLFKAYIEPISLLFAPLADAPQHLDNLSRQMKQTSDNLRIMRRGGRERLRHHQP